MNEETEAQSAQITCPRAGSKVLVLNHYLQCFKELWDYHLLGSKFSVSTSVCFVVQLYQTPSLRHTAGTLFKSDVTLLISPLQV